MRAGRTFALYILHLSIRLCGVFGFGTINEPSTIGQHCEHERITRAAFACGPGINISDGRCFEKLSLHQLAGRSGPEGYFGQGSNGAVGAPDMLDPVPEGPEAHCDNADFLDSAAYGLKEEYPRTREQATEQLQMCVSHLRERFSEGLDAADKVVDEHASIAPGAVDISTLDCRFSFRMLQMHVFSRSKCSAIEGFGRALHGIQDFYAHSNWADDATPSFGPDNPPGLKRSDYPSFLDLRAENNITEEVPHELSTGCFGGLLTDGPIGKAGHPMEPGSIDCTGRITHHTLNKDNGIIDDITGIATNPGPKTPRSDIAGNFERAVLGAIRDSNRQWRHFREEIRRTYGPERGNIIICALVRDFPTKDCYGRRIAILREAKKDGYKIDEVQVPSQQWLLEEIEGTTHDPRHDRGPIQHMALMDNSPTNGNSTNNNPTNTLLEDFEAKETYMDLPLSDNGNIDFGKALDDVESYSTLPTKKAAIVALTSTPPHDLHSQTAHILRARDKGIRVHVGVLLPPGVAPLAPKSDNDVTPQEREMEQELITAILRTGGTYSLLHSRSAVPSFLQHVVSRGLTQYDNARDTSMLLPTGLSISDFVSPESEPRRFSFDAHDTDNIIIAVAPITRGLSLQVRVRHVRRNLVIQDAQIGSRGNKTFKASLGVDDIPRTDAWFELEVGHVKGEGMVGSGLFEVSIETESTAKKDDLKASRKSDRSHDEL
jgi:hypothetical protein